MEEITDWEPTPEIIKKFHSDYCDVLAHAIASQSGYDVLEIRNLNNGGLVHAFCCVEDRPGDFDSSLMIDATGMHSLREVQERWTIPSRKFGGPAYAHLKRTKAEDYINREHLDYGEKIAVEAKRLAKFLLGRT